MPTGRYVDDYFGGEPEGIETAGGRCLTVTSALLGFPTATEKDADDCARMTVLGVDCEVQLDKSAVALKVDAGKAERWARALRQVLEQGFLEPGTAAKMAGRLSFAVTASAGKVAGLPQAILCACQRPSPWQPSVPLAAQGCRVVPTLPHDQAPSAPAVLLRGSGSCYNVVRCLGGVSGSECGDPCR